MTYPQAIKYLESFINYEKILSWPYKQSLKLERSEEFLTAIGNPQRALRCIHIAGSKGKGSTCAFISYILKEAGFKVGLYTSPHLSDFRERIRILEYPSSVVSRQSSLEFEGMISKGELTGLVEKLKPSIQSYNKKSKYGPLSFFEVYTSLAFAYFKEQKVDFAVLETGLGGRLDATNIVKPLVCGITPISYEHTQKLGNSLKEIATEKAGIIKDKNSIVISALQEKEVMEVIKQRCQRLGVKLYAVNKDLFYQKMRQGFNVIGIFDEYPNLETRLLGNHQLINVTLAIGVIEALRFFDIYVGIDSIRTGIYNTFWPGRCEIVAKDPLIILDGAQNIASSRALKETIKENFKYKRLILVLGISNDKDIKGICKELSDLADEVILTQASNPRATAPGILARYFNGRYVHKTKDVKEAKEISGKLANNQDLILITGSLFVVGEVRELLLESIRHK